MKNLKARPEKRQRYDRYEFEEKTVMKAKLKGNAIEEFGIDTRGTMRRKLYAVFKLDSI
jgi:hypothetical protein